MDIRQAAPSEEFFKIIGYKPYPYQKAIHDSWSLYRTAIIGRQSGKSEVAAVESAFEALTNIGSTGWTVAPTYEQATIIFERVVEYVKRGDSYLPGKRKLSISNRNLRLRIEHYSPEGNFLGFTRFQGKSGDNPDNLRGASLDYIVLDEAAMIDSNVWFAALAPTLTTTNGWVLIITTPKGYDWVYDFFQFGLRNQDSSNYPNYTRYASWQLPTWEANPSVPADFFEQQKAILPERVYDQEYGAEFIADSGSVFQGMGECPRLEIVQETHNSIIMKRPKIGHRYVIGADFARLDDFSVFTVVDLDDKEVVEVMRLNTIAWERQLEHLKQLHKKWPNSYVVADDNAQGDVLASQMASMGIPFEALGWKTNSIKEACINKLAIAIEHKRIKLPDSREYIDEFRDFIYERTPSGKLQMKAAGRGKDDRVSSLAMAWYHVPEHKGGEIETADDGFSISLDNDEFASLDELNRIFN